MSEIYPYEELFQKIVENCKTLDVPVFDYLPDEDQGYPFLMVGDQINTDEYTKDYVLGSTNITVHCWSEWNYKHDVYKLLERALRANYKNLQTDHFNFEITDSQQSILGETANDLKLWHGRLVLDINMI